MTHEEQERITEENIRRIVKEYGWYVALFESNTATPAFAYTIGLWKNFGHAEIISFGLPVETLGFILNNAGNLVKAGVKLKTNEDNQEIFENSPARFREVNSNNIPDYFGYGCWFNDYKPFPALQLFWTDTSFHYPWEDQYDKKLTFIQPLLFQKLKFKFFEAKNTACFTAKQIINDAKPILRLLHDEEGDWQFLTGEIVTEEDIMVVALEQIVKRDPTLNNLFDMPTGQLATREYVGGKWTRQNIEESD